MRRPYTDLVMICAVTAATPPVQAADVDAPTVDVGLQKQLLVDDRVIERAEALTRTLGEVTKANGGQPLVFTRRAADGSERPIDVWPAFATVAYDRERNKFRMWYRVSFDDRSRRAEGADTSAFALGVGSNYHRAYAESDDGIHFKYVAPLDGLSSSGDTNMVVTMDEHETDPEHRYKIGYDAQTEVHAAALAHSPDGIHWTPYNGEQPVTYRAADFTNQVYWDPAAQTYRLLTRTDFGAGGGPLAGSVDVAIGENTLEVRGVRSMTNPDIKADPTNWTLERHWLLDGEMQHTADRPPIEELLADPEYLRRVRREALRRQVYMLVDWTYESIHFGLMPVLEYPTDVSEGTETDQFTRHERSIENYYIITGRDGVGWNFQWVYAEEPLIPRGAEGAWDKDMVFPVSNIITLDDRHWIYYGGNNERHGCAEKGIWFARQGSIGLAWLRLDGFVAVGAGEKDGVLLTRPFRLEGRHVELNVDAGEGAVRMEVLDAAGNSIPEYSDQHARMHRNVNDVRFRPEWSTHSDLHSLVGRNVRLRITLRNAQLYAFHVRP